MSQNELKNTRKTSTKSIRVSNTLCNESRIFFKHQGTDVDTGYPKGSVPKTLHFESRLGRHWNRKCWRHEGGGARWARLRAQALIDWAWGNLGVPVPSMWGPDGSISFPYRASFGAGFWVSIRVREGVMACQPSNSHGLSWQSLKQMWVKHWAFKTTVYKDIQ